MKQNNDLVVLDFEATHDHKYIIDIGAVYLNKSLEIVSSFRKLVKPANDQQITPFITELTGITNEMVNDEICFDLAVIEFENWIIKCSSNPNLKHVRLCAWGNYFDMPLLRRNYDEIGREYPYHGGGYDVKTLAYTWCALSNRRTDKLSVKHIANEMGITPVGAYHRALVDAEVTAKILQRIFKDLSSGVFIEGSLYKVSKD